MDTKEIINKKYNQKHKSSLHAQYNCAILPLQEYKGEDAMAKADPVLLEPIMRVEVTTPEDYMGDVIGDINGRRGRIEGMEDIGGGKMIRGLVPLAEMFGYATDLRSKTQGRGNYSMFFERYERVPKNIQDKIVTTKAN